jgi:Ser/Thr protein kinase RdoA (MazF antagonist)
VVALASSALSRFRLTNPRIVGTLPASARNDNLLVEDARGERYVLRRYRRNPRPERIDFQLRFQEHLLRRGFPTSRLIESRRGERMLAFGGDFWSLFTYVRGTEYDYGSEVQLREAARLLARFHRAAEGFKCREVRHDTIPDLRRWWVDGERELERLDEMFGGFGVEAELDFLHAWQSELMRTWPLAELDALPTAWVHGDYHGGNMVFAGDRFAGLFDFDVVHRGARAEDVGLALFTFGRESRYSCRIRPRAARLFVEEYGRDVHLIDLERRVLPLIVIVVHARTAARYALRQRSGEDPVRIFRIHVGRMRALQAQMASLRPAFVEG